GEAEAVQRSDRTLCFEMVYRFEPGPDVHAKAKQPRDISEDEMDLEHDFRRHVSSYAGSFAYKLRRKSIMAALPSGARSCSVQGPQPGSMIAGRSWGAIADCVAINWELTA